MAESTSRAGHEDAGHIVAPARSVLAHPLQDHDRNLPRGLPLVFPEPGGDGDALGIHAIAFLALYLTRPHLEGLRAGLRSHLHRRYGICLEVEIPRGIVRRPAFRRDDNVSLPVALVHQRRDALPSAP